MLCPGPGHGAGQSCTISNHITSLYHHGTGCHVQRSLSCDDLNLVDLASNIVQLTKQYQLDSLPQEVCIYDLAHNELELLGLLVGNSTLPGSLSACYALSWSRSLFWLISHYIKSCNLSVS